MYRQSEKNLLSSNISSTCPHNMVHFGPLAAEIFSLVLGTPGNFNGFRVLASLVHGTLVVGVSQTAALDRGRHLYSAGRPSRWALAHISSFFLSFIFFLWSPYVIGQSGRPLYFHAVVCSFFYLFSSPNLSRRRLDVCHTSTHGVALVRI